MEKSLILLLQSVAFLGASLASPSNPRTEWLSNPINVDNPAPRFSWEVSTAQTAYRVVVKSSASVMWDTGNVSSSETSGIEYKGEKLSSDTDYTWTVATADLAGVWTTSSVAYFGTALLDESDWQGVWVGGSNQLAANFPLPPVAIVRARVYVTAVGCYELWINGARVSRGGLNASEPPSFVNPGISTIFSERLLYNAYDVTAFITSNATNVVGLRVGSCKYGYLGEFCTGNASTW